MKTVCIYGMAPNLSNTPLPPKGAEVWLSNNPKGYKQRLHRALGEWTRYFNLHSRKHMLEAYPDGFAYFQSEALKGGRFVFQKAQPDVKGSLSFPFKEIQKRFPEAGRYYTCSVCWLIALAILEGFERIELWGFEVRSSKPAYAWERPCVYYWILKAREAGLEVWTPPEMVPGEPGDPDSYEGPIYGLETKPEE